MRTWGIRKGCNTYCPNSSQKMTAGLYSFPLYFKEFGTKKIHLARPDSARQTMNLVATNHPQKKTPEHVLNAILKSSEINHKSCILR